MSILKIENIVNDIKKEQRKQMNQITQQFSLLMF